MKEYPFKTPIHLAWMKLHSLSLSCSIMLISRIRGVLERDVVQDCMNLCVHASSPRVFLITKNLLGSFVHYRKHKELWNRLTELYEPVLFRSLSAVNARVRRQAVIVFTDCFPLGTSDSRDSYSIEEQFKAILVGHRREMDRLS